MIFVKPSKTFEASAFNFTTGLVGTIGVRVVDGQGGTSIARTTSGIVESPSGSGVYTATLTAPADVGQYEVVWDDAGSPTRWAAEDLTVTASGSVPVTGSTGVGMTFAQLLTEFYARGFNYLDDSGAGTIRAKRFINQAYHDICEMDDWPFLQTSVTGTVPLSISDLGTVESIIDQTDKRVIQPADRRSLVDAYVDLSQEGNPESYYITEGDTINTYPVSTNSLKVRYWRLVNDLEESTDQPVIPARYQYAIIEYACMRAYTDSDNPEMAQFCRSEGDRLIQMMRERLLYQQHQQPDVISLYNHSTDYR